MRTERVLAVVFLALAAALPVRAVNYFVALNGNDFSNNGTAAATPFRTISRAASLVAAGDTVTVAAGTYNEAVTIIRPGSASAAIAFRSPVRGAARIVGQVSIRSSYIEFSGFDVSNPGANGINLVGHHLRILNNDVHDCSGNGINGFASDYLTIEGNRLFRNGLENNFQASGIALFQPVAFDQAPGYHIVIRGNRAFDNESRVNTRGNVFTIGNGILLDDFRNLQDGSTAGPYRPATLVENNLLYNNVGRALVISNTDNVVVRNNTAWGNLRIRNTTATAATNGTFTSQDTDGIRWYNNIVATRVAADVAVFEARTTNAAWDYNVISTGAITAASAGFGSHNYFTDPLLVDPAGGNFRPGRGSLAIDGGHAVQAAATDVDGAARPLGRAVDIGAFEVAPDPTAPSGPPVFVGQIPSQTLLTGSFTTLAAYANGAAPLTYQWSRNGESLPGATNATLTFAPLTAADGGSYSVTVANGAGRVTSNTAAVSTASVPDFVWRNPLPRGGSLNAVAFGAGKFVAVGVNGRVLVSTDGAAWNLVATLPSTGLNGVAFDVFQWVAVGNGGTLFTSRDAVTWTQRNASTTNTLRSVATVNNAWIVSGDGGTIITSLDGVNWSVRSSGVTQNLYAVAGTTGRYVATGQTGVLLTSPDTVSWTRITLNGATGTALTGDFYAAAYIRGQFIVAGANAGGIFASVDGTAWVARTSPGNTNTLRGVVHNGTQYVFVTDSDRVVVTPDLAGYTNVTIPAYSITVPRWSVAYGAGQFVTVGNGGEISSSTDGMTWTPRGALGARWINYNAAFVNSQWIAVGSSGGVMTSPDGVTWTRQSAPNIWMHGCAYGAGRYVVAGDGGWIISSADGVAWAGQSNSGTTQNLIAVAFTNGRFVAVGNNGAIVTSTDGMAWSAVTSGVTTTLQNVGTFAGRFYAIGNNGVILVSPDGVGWNPANSGSTQTLIGIGTDGATLYVVGANRTILASTDGQTWTPRTPPALNNGTYRGIARSNGGWLIVGDAGVALFSLDGVTWSFLPVLAEGEQLTAVTSNGLTTIATGAGGTILQANDPVTAPIAGAPVVARSIPSQNVLPGSYTTFAADATGSAPFTYQWNKNGSAMPGATNATLSFAPVQARDGGVYSVTVTNAAGSTTSRPATLTVTPFPEFAWRNPLAEGGTLNAVTYASGRFVAVGTGSRVLTSIDGATWNLAATVPTWVLFGIGSDGVQWVAVGNNGALYTSFDTVNWSQRNPATTVNLRSVVSVGGIFVACGDSGVVTTSPDGATWTVRGTGVTQTLFSVAGTPGRYVAVGQAGTLLTSPDAIAWTRVPLTTATGAAITGDLNAVAYLNGQFIAVGASGVIVASPDGTTWTARTSAGNTNTLRGVAHNGSQYVFLADNDRAVVTPNLTTYTNVTIPAHNPTVLRTALAHGAGQFVVVGNGSEIASSPDGTAWTQRGASGARGHNSNVAFVNDRWMAVGASGTVLMSSDGMTWTRQPAPTANYLSGCAHGAGRYVVVGLNGWISSSPDAVTWTGNGTASGTTQWLLGVVFANGRFVAVANGGAIVTSTNGTVWTAANSGVTTSLNSVGVFDGRFFAVGNSGVILTSGDGTTWTPLASGTTQTLLGIGTDGTTLYVVGTSRTILASTDGRSWTPRTAPAINHPTYRGIAKVNGGWIVVGDAGVALFSIDGVVWEYLPTQANGETLSAIASNSIGAVAVGNGTTIVQAFNTSFGQSRLTNVATRGLVPPGGSLTPGFVLRGTGMKNVVVRAVGPTLSTFGLDALSDLKFDLVNQQTNALTASNDDWGGNGSLTASFAALGAFPLPPASRDAAVQAMLPVNSGGYSVRIAASGAGTSGLALAEVYDADDDQSPVRLVNVSTLGFVGTGDNVLTPGFVIRGSGAKLLLIRAVGPGLAALGVTGVLADPQLTVYAAGSGAVMASNNDWGGNSTLKSAFTAAGAFSIPDNSRDAVVIATLPPGGYTVVTSGVGNSTGVALVEVYDLDP